jgi:hypothetical protein
MIVPIFFDGGFFDAGGSATGWGVATGIDSTGGTMGAGGVSWREAASPFNVEGSFGTGGA